MTSWIRAAGLNDEYRRCYTTLSAAGKCADFIAALLVLVVIRPLLTKAERLSFTINDTPTKRYGPYVEGAGNRGNAHGICN